MSAPDLFVKICGITRAQDAELAAALGASAIGFIFWQGSPRYVTPEAAHAIVRQNTGAVRSVGVFVDETVERMCQIAELVGLDLVQLHGNESASVARDLSRAWQSHGRSEGRVIKAVGLENGSLGEVTSFDADVLILLDAHDAVRHGGTGRTINWDAARGVAASRRTILSGGLNPENIASAIAAVNPYGVDVSSGVESSAGIKDAVRMKSFFEALND